MSVYNCMSESFRERKTHSLTCGRAAVGGGGGGGGARGGGGGGGGTGMLKPQIPAEKNTVAIPVHALPLGFFPPHVRSCYCEGTLDDLLPSSLDRKSFHQRTAQNRKQQALHPLPRKSDTSLSPPPPLSSSSTHNAPLVGLGRGTMEHVV